MWYRLLTEIILSFYLFLFFFFLQVQQEDVNDIHFLVFKKSETFVLTAYIDTDLKLLPSLTVSFYTNLH